MSRPKKEIEGSNSLVFLNKVFWSGHLTNQNLQTNSSRWLANTLNSIHWLILFRFYDPDLWEAHYLASFRQVLTEEVILMHNNADIMMTFQILASLFKEAPFIYEKLDKKEVNFFINHYFDKMK